jgi:hypothetical protein
MTGTHTVLGLGSGPVKKKIYSSGDALFVNHGGESYLVKLKGRVKILNNPPLYHETYEVLGIAKLLLWEDRIWNRFLSTS